MQAHIAFTVGVCKELEESGELVSAKGLSFPDQAKLSWCEPGSAVNRSRTASSRNPKEFLARYWIVDAESLESAYAIAAKASAAPGPGGAP
jgi:hypothetical protein